MQKITTLFLLLAVAIITGCSSDKAVNEEPGWAIAIHGGAGSMQRDKMPAATAEKYRQTLSELINGGGKMLGEGASALDVVENIIRRMEDDSLFNAGRGAVLTHEKTAELDASIMDGSNRMAGAVAGIKTIRHPISAARAVMEKTGHVLLAGEGAEDFARETGLETVPNSFFITPRRRSQIDRILASETEEKLGTVGVVVRDKKGILAAGTSTGGRMNKMFGRIGDSPIIGAGTYADNTTCAVSATGEGEYFIRLSIASRISARMAYLDEDIVTAAQAVILQDLEELGGVGGVIAVDKNGNIAFAFNTSGMFRASLVSGKEPYVAIFGDE